MPKYWSRENTQYWISQLENRIDDIEYYLHRTIEWCEINGVWDEEKVFTLSFITVLWVTNMRNEDISKRELLEILGISGWEDTEDLVYELGKESRQMDHEELLKTVLEKFD